MVEDLDLTADMEWPAVWEAEFAELEFTGIWAEDLLSVAESQLGYAESKRNCIWLYQRQPPAKPGVLKKL